MRVLLTACSAAILATQIPLRGQDLPDHCRAQIVAVIDARTILCRVFEPAEDVFSPCLNQGAARSFQLNGVWSQPALEPRPAYDQRLQLMRRLLLGRVIYLPVVVTVLTSQGATAQIRTLNPRTDPVLADRSSLDELLMRSGAAMLDEDPLSSFKPAQRQERYKAAENEAITARRGIWQPAISRFYLDSKQEMALRVRLQWAGMGFFAGMQALLVAVILGLRHLLRGHSEARFATSLLLILPLANSTPDLWLWQRSAGDLFQPQNVLHRQLAILLPLGAIVLALVGFGIFSGLLHRGPADVWGATAAGLRSRYIGIFFLGLWIGILLFAFAYSIAGQPFAAAFHASTSVAFGFPPGVVHPTPASRTMGLAEGISLFIWVGLCAAPIRPQPTLTRGSLGWNLSVILACLAITTLAISSLFGITLFNLNFSSGHGLQPAGRRECFMLALATLFHQSSTAFQIHSRWTEPIVIVETHVLFFLGLVGFRTLWALRSSPA